MKRIPKAMAAMTATVRMIAIQPQVGSLPMGDLMSEARFSRQGRSSSSSSSGFWSASVPSSSVASGEFSATGEAAGSAFVSSRPTAVSLSGSVSTPPCALSCGVFSVDSCGAGVAPSVVASDISASVAGVLDRATSRSELPGVVISSPSYVGGRRGLGLKFMFSDSVLTIVQVGRLSARWRKTPNVTGVTRVTSFLLDVRCENAEKP